MTTTWQEAARGIDLWLGARVREEGDCGTKGWEGIVVPSVSSPGSLSVLWQPDGNQWMQTSVTHGTTIRLDEPRTRAAFDRELALRLGAPIEAVDEGVVIFCHNGNWTISAGGPRGFVPTWFRAIGTVGVDTTDDPLLTRALAWHHGDVKRPRVE